MFPIPDDLQELHRDFFANGHDLVFVGGCVRDSLVGISPKDFDLATDAHPDWVATFCVATGRRVIPTGIQHGTVTVVLGSGQYEVTTFRRDVETDGRHAVVEFTPLIDVDLARRDLTINAMALTFFGSLRDPFGGREDLAAGRVRFVGDPYRRVEEDYLRILRWLRFHARFGKGDFDGAACEAAFASREGLAGVSRERVWSEVSRMLALPAGRGCFEQLIRLDLGYYIGLPSGDLGCALRATSDDPVAVLSAYAGREVVDLAKRWRWPRADFEKADFISREAIKLSLSSATPTSQWRKLLWYDARPRAWVVDLFHSQGREDVAAEVEAAETREFPVRGQDLIDLGVPAGKEVGAMLGELRARWRVTGYIWDREQLLGDVRAVLARRG